MIDHSATPLYSSLITLGKKVIGQALLYKEEAKLNEIAYQSLPPTEISYQSNTYNPDWDKMRYFNVYEWDAPLYGIFLDEIRTLEEFKAAAVLLSTAYGILLEYVNLRTLAQFVSYQMQHAPNERIKVDDLPYIVSLFLNDLDTLKGNSATTWKVTIWLENIHLSSAETNIAPGVFLRQPSAEQLTETKPKTNYVSQMDRLTGRAFSNTAILSFSVDASGKNPLGWYPDEVGLQIEIWQNLFRLLKPAQVKAGYMEVKPVSVTEQPISRNGGADNNVYENVAAEDKSTFKLYLSREEESLLAGLITRILPALQHIKNENYLKGEPHDLALHRYNDALLQSEINGYRILSSMTSLEALLSDGSAEITFKIRLRVAKLLSYFGFNAIEVSGKIRDAYALRSKLVHGAKPEEKNKDLLKFAREHTHEILNYNRTCLLISLQLRDLSKAALIQLIDHSLIDQNEEKKLKELIEEKVIVPFPHPFRRLS